MQIKLQILFILIFILISSGVIAQCIGGNFGGNLNFSTTTQTFTANGNTYYTFQADSGDRYYFQGGTNVQNPGSITILDNSGTIIYEYTPLGYEILWKAPYTGTFRALTNMPPCQTSNVILGTINYTHVPYLPFPTDSAQWSIRKTINNPFSQHTTQYKMKGDTIINGLTYLKIYSGVELNYFSSLDTLHCFLREELRKIYVKYPITSGYDTTEILLYDFNLSIGDTFPVRLLNYNTDSIFDFVVEEIFTYNIINEIRTLYKLKPTNSFSYVWGGMCDHLQWHEEFGAFQGLLYLEIPELECDNFSTEYGIACIWQNGQYLIGGTFCDVNTGIIETDQDLISIYPNPSASFFNIQLDNANFKKIEIINSNGSLVENIEASNSDNIRIEHNLPVGLYLLRLIQNNGTSHFKKIIIR